MWELFYKIFIGHLHIWDRIDTINMYESYSDELPISRKYVCKCKYCGKIKTFHS